MNGVFLRNRKPCTFIILKYLCQILRVAYWYKLLIDGQQIKHIFPIWNKIIFPRYKCSKNIFYGHEQITLKFFAVAENYNPAISLEWTSIRPWKKLNIKIVLHVFLEQK